MKPQILTPVIVLYTLWLFGLISGNTEIFTMTWSVRPGLNRVSCFSFEKARELKKTVCSVSYSKYENDGVNYTWIGGINYCDVRDIEWNGNIENVSAKFQLLYESGKLEINITEEDDHDKYLCSVLGPKYREAIQIMLLFFTGEAQTGPCNTSFPVIYLTETTENSDTSCTCPADYCNLTCPVNTTICSSENSAVAVNKTTSDKPCESDESSTVRSWDLTDTMLVLALVVSIVINVVLARSYLKRCFLRLFENIRGLFRSENENTSSNSVNHENPTFENPATCQPDASNGPVNVLGNHDDRENRFGIRENNTDTGILPYNALGL